MLKKANQLLSNENYQQAIQEYDRVIALKPDQENLKAAYYNKAQAYDSLRQYTKSAQMYENIIEIDPNYQKGEVYWDMGQVYQMARMYTQCRKAYQIYLKYQPNNAECNFNLGKTLQTIGQQQLAINYLARAIDIKSNYARAYVSIISILKKLNRYEEILKYCSRALKFEPTDFEIRYEEGYAFSNLKRYKSAEESFRQSIGNNKKFVRGYIALGDIYYKLERDTDGLDILKKCLQVNKDVVKPVQRKQIRLIMGIIYMNLKNYKQAVTCFREVLSQKPILQNVKIKLATCLEEVGNEYFNKKQFSDSLVYYNESIKIDSNRISALNNSGLAYQSINQFKQAQNCFQEVLKRQPKNAHALNNIATLYSTTGKGQQAQKIFKQLSNQNPNNLEAMINTGKIYMGIRKYRQALNEFFKVQKLAPNSNNYCLYNDMAVALQQQQRYQQALMYANKANYLTSNKSPLLVLNRASILMNLRRIQQARNDFETAANQLRNTDKTNLIQFGINNQNMRYMKNQLNHYAYLMTPIKQFKEGLLNQIKQMQNTDQEKYTQITKRVEKAEYYAMSRIISEIKKQSPQQTPNPQQSRNDYNTIQQAIKQMQEMKKEILSLKESIAFQKSQSQKMKELLRFLPESINLRKKFKELEEAHDIPILNYGKQLYWILNYYLKGYMLISTGVVAKGENINRSTFSKAMGVVQSFAEFSKLGIPIISDYSDLISRVSGLFIDMEDDAIIEKVYQIISYNYNTEEDLNDAVCESIVLFLSNEKKIEKIREKLVFKPSQSFLERCSQTVEEIKAWFQDKKQQFIMHMRGFQKGQHIVQSELAVIDVGSIIAVLLNITSDSNTRLPVLTNAAKRVLANDAMEEMVLQSYNRQNQNLRVSNNGFCLVMRCQIIYDNPLLNSKKFLSFLKQHNYTKAMMKKILEFDQSVKYYLEDLIVMENFQEIICLIDYEV